MTDEQLVDRLLLEWSWRCEKGYPDLNSEKDVKILESILGEEVVENLFELERNFNPLTWRDLTKDPDRRERFLQKIKKGDTFDTKDGKQVQISFINTENESEDSIESAFEKGDQQELSRLVRGTINQAKFFEDKDGNTYSIEDFLKTQEFGGRGKGSGTREEDLNLKSLQDQIKKLVEENGGNPIKVFVEGQEPKEIVYAQTQPGTPKSDFNIIDENSEPTIFISHKKKGNATAFVRWSGFTRYVKHREVQQFNEALRDIISKTPEWEDKLPRETSFTKRVEDPELARKLIYGPDYGKKFSKQFVNIVIQGEIELERKGSSYKLTGDNTLIPPELPSDQEYHPYLTSTFRREVDRRNFGIPTNEAIARPKAGAYNYTTVYLLENGEFKKIIGPTKEGLELSLEESDYTSEIKPQLLQYIEDYSEIDLNLLTDLLKYKSKDPKNLDPKFGGSQYAYRGMTFTKEFIEKLTPINKVSGVTEYEVPSDLKVESRSDKGYLSFTLEEEVAKGFGHYSGYVDHKKTSDRVGGYVKVSLDNPNFIFHPDFISDLSKQLEYSKEHEKETLLIGNKFHPESIFIIDVDAIQLSKEYIEPADPSQVNSKELSMGIKVEMEHTDNPEEAKVVALQHLAEDPKYYSKLQTLGLENHGIE